MVAKKSRRFTRVLVAVGVVLLVAFVVVLVIASPMGGGYVSKIACSEVFVAGRKLDHVKEHDLAPYGFVSVSADREQRTVTAKVLGLLGATAVHRRGLGCTVMVDSDVAALRERAFDAPEIARPAEDAPWPAGNAVHGDPVDGLNRQALDAAIAQAFEEPNADALRRTRGVAVVYDGKLVAERYGDGFDAESRLLGWSMTKSVTNALIGIAVHRGLLTKEEPANIAAWQGDERKAITVDQLLRMSSGLAFDETYQPLTDATEMLFQSADTAAAAAAHELAGPPDSVWSYSSGTTNILCKLLRDRVGDDAAYHRFPYEHLFKPLGMSSARIEADGSGTFVGSSFMYATVRDWARFGLLYLRDGVWNGQRILPDGWVAYSHTPTGKAPKGSYGAQFWLNAGTAGDGADRPFPSLPSDLYYASGYQGQKVAVVPSRRAVIVRLGMTHQRGAFPFEKIAADILAALPPASP